MSKIDAEKLYLQIKEWKDFKNISQYKEEYHCTLILDVMNNEGTMAAFCKKANISSQKFYYWIKTHPLFKECYLIGKMYSRANWEQEGENGKDDENFNFVHWRNTGACRYGAGNVNRVRLELDPESNPYEQYQQLIRQAGDEEFTASEIKQLMESINVGRSTYETFKLQESIDKMQEDVSRMQINHVNHSSTIEKTTKTD